MMVLLMHLVIKATINFNWDLVFWGEIISILSFSVDTFFIDEDGIANSLDNDAMHCLKEMYNYQINFNKIKLTQQPTYLGRGANDHASNYGVFDPHENIILFLIL